MFAYDKVLLLLQNINKWKKKMEKKMEKKMKH